jgi:hypothetical protein
MILIIRNDQGQWFEFECPSFQGYDVFCAVRDQWDYDWHTYQVIHEDQVLENVLNPNGLDPSTAVSIH